MTIDDLISRLEDYRDEHGGETEVRLMTQQNWPFENGIAGLASGLRGGAAYEGFLQREGPARGAWDGVSVGTLVAVVLMLGAGTYNLYLIWNEREQLRRGAAR